MISKSKAFLFAVAGLALLGCSKSSEPNTINSLYRESDSYRLRLQDAGCRITNQTMGNKTSVVCSETQDKGLLLQRAQLLKEWSKVLEKIEGHPDFPGVASNSYQRLRSLVSEYAENVENKVMTDLKNEEELVNYGTAEYERLAALFSAEEAKLKDLGCDFLSDPRPETFDETCDFYHPTEKIEILSNLEKLPPQGQELQTRLAGTHLEQVVLDLYVKMIDVTMALKAHLRDNAEKIRQKANTTVSELRYYYGLGFKAGLSAEIEITLPVGKRNQESIEELKLELVKFIDLIQTMLFYIDFYDSPSIVTVHERRMIAAKEFLSLPLSLEYIIENFEPEPLPYDNTIPGDIMDARVGGPI